MKLQQTSIFLASPQLKYHIFGAAPVEQVLRQVRRNLASREHPPEMEEIRRFPEMGVLQVTIAFNSKTYGGRNPAPVENGGLSKY